jgi:hypothetical protein
MTQLPTSASEVHPWHLSPSRQVGLGSCPPPQGHTLKTRLSQRHRNVSVSDHTSTPAQLRHGTVAKQVRLASLGVVLCKVTSSPFAQLPKS